jgi:hypothetical protein
MTKREQVIFAGELYSFSLGLVQKRMLKQKRWTALEAVKLSDRLSRRLQKVVQGFFVKASL